MRKFSGSMGSVSRLTIESQALKSNMLARIMHEGWRV